MIVFGLLSCFAQIELPARFDNDLIYLHLPLQGGAHLELFTDTGGGLFLVATAAQRLGLELEKASNGGNLAHMPMVAGDLPPLPEKMFVMQGPAKRLKAVGDGMLGQAWFGDRIWTFDYGQKRLLYHDTPPKFPPEHKVGLTFLVKEEKRLTQFPCIEARIDGRTMPFLFDTGAQIDLREHARKGVGDGDSSLRATCFIVASVFDTWRQNHPDWPVILDADRMVSEGHLIQVPRVSIAGYEVGPVWFTRRPDTNFHDYMSGMMGCKVEGALGGSLFHYFKITVDYPSAEAHFEKLP